MLNPSHRFGSGMAPPISNRGSTEIEIKKKKQKHIGVQTRARTDASRKKMWSDLAGTPHAGSRWCCWEVAGWLGRRYTRPRPRPGRLLPLPSLHRSPHPGLPRPRSGYRRRPTATLTPTPSSAGHTRTAGRRLGIWPRRREQTKYEPKKGLGDLSITGAKKNKNARERGEMVVYLAIDARSTTASTRAAMPGHL